MGHLKVFGCQCYMHKNKQDKLNYTSIEAIFWDIRHKKKI
jgi:hypothetical protein